MTTSDLEGAVELASLENFAVSGIKDSTFFDHAPLDTMPRGRLTLIGCNSGIQLATRVANEYNRRLGHLKRRPLEEQERVIAHPATHDIFSDHEIISTIEESVDGADVYVFSTPQDPTQAKWNLSDNILNMLFVGDALRDNGASHLTLVIPYLPYSRQEKTTPGKRQPISAAWLARAIADAGYDRVICLDVHSKAIRGFYTAVKVRFTPLDSFGFFLNYFEQFREDPNTQFVALDAGAFPMGNYLSRALNLPLGQATKIRHSGDETEHVQIIGVGRRRVLLGDDIIATAGSIESLGNRLHNEYGVEEIYVAASHGLFTGPAMERLQRMHDSGLLKEVVITNSVTHADGKLPSFLKVHDLVSTLALVANRAHYSRSVSKAFYMPQRLGRNGG
ncbi:ribose-phosphate pyrophosphokinase [Candidatus Woesearchaeota archaeon]|nr:ribose-phosphate pyrophosphokinase [Candidatus Woesearchaeota archaeon]